MNKLRFSILVVVVVALSLVLGSAGTHTALASLPRTLPIVNDPATITADLFQHVWPFKANNTDGSSVAVDAAGGIHLGFTAHTSNR
jgi:hypothetical protein